MLCRSDSRPSTGLFSVQGLNSLIQCLRVRMCVWFGFNISWRNVSAELNKIPPWGQLVLYSCCSTERKSDFTKTEMEYILPGYKKSFMLDIINGQIITSKNNILLQCI